MRKFFLFLLPVFLLLVGQTAWGTDVTINFGTDDGDWAAHTNNSYTDSDSRTWSCTYSAGGKSSGTATYSQFGNTSNTCTSLAFTATVGSDVTVSAFSVTMAGASGSSSPTTGTIYLYKRTVGGTETQLATASVSGTSSVVCEITSNQEFSSTDILKVSYVGTAKAIRVSKLSYSYTTSGGSSDPSITLGSSSIEATEAGADGTISVTYNNITDVVAEVQFFASDGTTPATYDWVTAEINSSNNVEYLVEANTGSARTAYMKVYALDDESNDVYSALITISQEAKSVAAPAFSLNTGRYFTGTTFTLTSKGNTIYYTTDNSTPTNLSTEYTGPVAIISGAKTYKAIAYDTYGNSSTVVSRTFTGIAPANLPFSFDDGKSKIEATAGLIQSGLDSDYGSSPKLKFNSTGDYVILKIDENPGTLSFDIVGNSYSGSSVFKVQTSANGVDYTDLDSYTTLGSTTSKEYNSLGESVRYIRWIYANKDNGNVGLGNISLDNKLHISLSSYQWGTLVANVPLDFEGSTVKAYIVTGHSGAALTKTQMTGTVPANTPLLINAPMDSYEIPVASSSSTDVSENKLVAGTGTAISKEAGKTKYVLSVDGGIAAFKLIDTNSATVPKDKAYLLFNESITLAPSVIRIVDEENNATNIDAIDATEEAVKFIENGKLYILRDGVVYDALGRMVR